MHSRSHLLYTISFLSAVAAIPTPFDSLPPRTVLASHPKHVAHAHPPGFSLLGYQPNLTINAIGAGIFGIVALSLSVQQARKRAGYMLAMTIGVWFYLMGIVVRFPLRSNPDNLGIFLIQNMAIILSPCAFIASVYAVLGQIALRQGADDCLPVRPTKIAKYFIWSDVLTFLVQAGGGGMEVKENLSNIGSKIFLSGLILQLASFLIFCSFFLIFIVRLRSRHPRTFANRSWHPLAWALAVACIGIVIRSSFRTIENSQGFHGYLAIHEGYFWLLDALPLVVATGIFIPFWPERYLPAAATKHHIIAMNPLDSR